MKNSRKPRFGLAGWFGAFALTATLILQSVVSVVHPIEHEFSRSVTAPDAAFGAISAAAADTRLESRDCALCLGLSQAKVTIGPASLELGLVCAIDLASVPASAPDLRTVSGPLGARAPPAFLSVFVSA
ncbi:MAG: hypothetical protein AB7P04_02940 [Bacteriovoracia bacterium]